MKQIYLIDFYFIASIPDPCFKDFKFLQSKNSKKNILPAEWLAKATNCFKVEFDAYGQLRELNLVKLLLRRTLGRNSSSVEDYFQDDNDEIASKPMHCVIQGGIWPILKYLCSFS